MSLMAVAEGARGVFFWSMGNRGLASVRDENQRREYGRRVRAVAQELKSLAPALAAPDAPQVVAAVSDPRIRWRAREALGEWYVFACLPAAKFTQRADGPPAAVTFTLRDGQTVRKEFRPDTAEWFRAAP